MPSKGGIGNRLNTPKFNLKATKKRNATAEALADSPAHFNNAYGPVTCTPPRSSVIALLHKRTSSTKIFHHGQGHFGLIFQSQQVA